MTASAVVPDPPKKSNIILLSLGNVTLIKYFNKFIGLGLLNNLSIPNNFFTYSVLVCPSNKPKLDLIALCSFCNSFINSFRLTCPFGFFGNIIYLSDIRRFNSFSLNAQVSVYDIPVSGSIIVNSLELVVDLILVFLHKPLGSLSGLEKSLSCRFSPKNLKSFFF